MFCIPQPKQCSSPPSPLIEHSHTHSINYCTCTCGMERQKSTTLHLMANLANDIGQGLALRELCSIPHETNEECVHGEFTWPNQKIVIEFIPVFRI